MKDGLFQYETNENIHRNGRYLFFNDTAVLFCFVLFCFVLFCHSVRAVYNACDNNSLSHENGISILYHVIVKSQLNRDSLTRCYIM